MKLLLAIAILGASAWAAQPDIRNAQLTTEAAQPNLAQKIRQIEQSGQLAWIGYEVQTLKRHKDSYNGCGDVHYLEEEDRGNRTYTDERASSAILIRTENHHISKIEVISTECHIDAGGVPVHWLTGTNQDESVSFLNDLITGPETNQKLADSALFAIAIHQTPAATQALSRLAHTEHDGHIKEQAAFWLGVERGHEGFVVLEDLTNDSDPGFRKKLTFDISQNSDPAAIEKLIQMAKTDSATEVRGQAIFWLAQKAGKKQAALIAEIAQNDPDRSIKKKAVFALSQLPQDESYQQLVKVAETNRDPAIRKDAIFWLGQSKDPRALEYLEQVLRR